MMTSIVSKRHTIPYTHTRTNLSEYDTSSSNQVSFYYNIEKKLSILPVILMLTGTIGNMIAFYVLTRRKLRTQSTMLYFASLTVMDTISLYQWNFNFFYKYQLNSENQNLEDQSLFLCRYVSFMAHFSMQTSAWMLTIISIDRYLIVTNNNWKQKFSRNIKFSLIVILSIILIIAMINLPVAFYNGKLLINNKIIRNRTTTNRQELIMTPKVRTKKVECYTTKFIVFWQKVALSLECVFPLILMVVFNLLLIKRTYKSSTRLNKNEKEAKSRSDIKKSTSMACNLDPKDSRSFENSNFELTSSNDTKIPTKDNSCSSVNGSDKIKYLKPFKKSSNGRLKKKFKSEENSINKQNGKNESSLKVEPKSKNLSLSNLVFLKEPTKNPSFLSASNALSFNHSSSCNNMTSTSNVSVVNKINDSGETGRSLIIVTDSYRSSKKYFLNYRNRRIVLMLSLLTLSFTISTLPSSVFYTFFRPILNNKPYKRLLTMSFNLLRHLSHTFNFMIYFTSSSIIKQQLKEIFNSKNFRKFSWRCLTKFMNNCCFYVMLKLKCNNTVSNSPTKQLEKMLNTSEQANSCTAGRTRSGEFRMKIYSLPLSNSNQSNDLCSFQNQNDIEFIDNSTCEDSIYNRDIKVYTFSNNNCYNCDDHKIENKNDRKLSDLFKTDTKNPSLNVPKLMLNSKSITKNTDTKPSWF